MAGKVGRRGEEALGLFHMCARAAGHDTWERKVSHREWAAGGRRRADSGAAGRGSAARCLKPLLALPHASWEAPGGRQGEEFESGVGCRSHARGSVSLARTSRQSACVPHLQVCAMRIDGLVAVSTLFVMISGTASGTAGQVTFEYRKFDNPARTDGLQLTVGARSLTAVLTLPAVPLTLSGQARRAACLAAEGTIPSVPAESCQPCPALPAFSSAALGQVLPRRGRAGQPRGERVQLCQVQQAGGRARATLLPFL